MKLSRSDVAKKLREYVNGVITLKNLQDWELEMSRKDYEPTDWEEDYSFVNEIMMGEIDMSDIDGLSISKAKEIIRLLESTKPTKELIRELYELR